MSGLPRRWALAGVIAALSFPTAAHAQMHHHHPAAADSTARHGAMPAAHAHAAPTHHAAHGGMDMAGMDMGAMPMTGMLGPYAMTREASGTSWQPEAARHEGVHVMRGPWMLMLHGFADGVYDEQGGPRGDNRSFSSNMAMAMAQRPLGVGTFGLRSMLSLEPATIGSKGYPLLLQTGETADGVTPLIDRQHPHDLFMELAGTYSVASGDRSLFVYGGLPGEPALGPPAFMHRFSGMNIPVAPITHHWLDSTHITYGVLTAGAVIARVKLEASVFRGREPDQNRWNVETPKLDSHAFRLSVNPTDRWALQASYGRIHSPEQLEPDVNQDRITASAMYDGTWGDTGRWEGMVAWGRNRNPPGRTLDAYTAEGALQSGERHTMFVRLERVAKDELLLAPDPRAGQVFEVGELTAGYRYDFLRRDHVALGIGGAGTLSRIPAALHDDYGDTPASTLLFLHAALR
ncbi:MAG TPA: hypothetical protein VFK69_02715 [Candidatus Eisenbacteria bacterium]|nr:hypothetical protein [Candidatus Eisenbacteria bacterium]